VRLRRSTLTAGLALAFALTGTARAATLTPALAADYGAGWLGRQLDATGYIAALSGPDYNSTALAVLALVAAEVGEEQAAEATEFLFDNVDAYVVDGNGDDRPAALATLILVAHARGLDPSSLVTRLAATERTTGDNAGLYGEQDAMYDGAYRQGLALLALAAAGQTDADAIGWLKAEQCASGGWMGNNPDPSAACPAFDFDSFVGVDSNGTALAAMGLAALGETPAHDPLGYLADIRNDDGGWPFTGGLGSDANSTALAVQALLALGEEVDADADGYLLALQLPNPPAATAGAFAFQPGGSANTFATVQVVPALAGRTPLVAPATLSAALPLLPAEVVATPTPAPSTSPPAPSLPPAQVVDNAPVRELADTGLGEKPWDATGQVVFGLGLVGYGVLALGAARLVARRRHA
jgi:hypothetical protein